MGHSVLLSEQQPILSPIADVQRGLHLSSKPTHILVVSHAWYGDVIGGAFRLASEFAEFLAARGNRVSFVCCAGSADATESSEEVVHGVRIFRYRPDTIRRNGLARLRFHVRQTRSLVQAVHSADPVDAVSGHSPLQMLGALQALPASIFSNYAVHSPFDDELASNGSGGRFARHIAVVLARRVDRSIILRSDRMQTDSEYTLRSMIRKHGSAAAGKGIVASGWVETDRFQPVANRREFRYSLGSAWQTQDPVFFTLRRLENRMGLETLIDACRQLQSAGLQFRTLIGGGGSLRPSLQQRIVEAGLQDRVMLLGRLPEEQLAAVYAGADCFVLPTRSLECFGLIVLEAFACGTPVIASDVAAIPELAARQGRAWMFEPSNTEQLADRMRSFIAGRLKPVIDLRSVAIEFDKPKVLQRWEELLSPG